MKTNELEEEGVRTHSHHERVQKMPLRKLMRTPPPLSLSLSSVRSASMQLLESYMRLAYNL